MSMLSVLHDQVFARRIRVLGEQIGEKLAAYTTVLDVGCGDGALAREILGRHPDLAIEGIDVLVRPVSHIPVKQFDGTTLPYSDGSVDAVIFVDVLHHTDTPGTLLREACRVARRAVIIKDHLADRIAARPTLQFMDWVGNARHGVRLPYNYFTRQQWRRTIDAAGLQIVDWSEDIPLYPAPASWLFGGSLHVLAVLAPDRAKPSDAPS